MYCFGSPLVFCNLKKNYLPNILCLNFTQMNLEILFEKSENVAPRHCTSAQEDRLAWPHHPGADAACLLLGRGKCPLLILHSLHLSFVVCMVIFTCLLYLLTFHRYLRLCLYFGMSLKYVLRFGKLTHLHVPLE